MEFYSRDIQILRQSQSKIVLEYFNSLDLILSVEELQRVTDVFVECCLRPQDKELKDRIKSLDKWILDKLREKKLLTEVK
jgi:hypothetical protein